MNLNLLDPKLIALVAAVIVIIAVLAWLYVRKRRSTTADLRQKFGPEYDRAVLKHGSERKAQSKLEDREKRVEKLNIRDLDPTEHERFSKRWESVQSRFVDSPSKARQVAPNGLSGHRWFLPNHHHGAAYEPGSGSYWNHVGWRTSACQLRRRGFQNAVWDAPAVSLAWCRPLSLPSYRERPAKNF